jgi:septal ring factor EnvC (AmiA/AmiB activator)
MKRPHLDVLEARCPHCANFLEEGRCPHCAERVDVALGENSMLRVTEMLRVKDLAVERADRAKERADIKVMDLQILRKNDDVYKAELVAEIRQLKLVNQSLEDELTKTSMDLAKKRVEIDDMKTDMATMIADGMTAWIKEQGVLAEVERVLCSVHTFYDTLGQVQDRHQQLIGSGLEYDIYIYIY